MTTLYPRKSKELKMSKKIKMAENEAANFRRQSFVSSENSFQKTLNTD